MKKEAKKEETAGGNLLLPALPVRIQRSRKQKQVSPNGLPIVYVGRPSKWGNPYFIKKLIGWGDGLWQVFNQTFVDQPLITFGTKEEAVRYCVQMFKRYSRKINVTELKGKNLSCWCPLDCKCHADILLELSNREGHGR
jgi:hypothetical protein